MDVSFWNQLLNPLKLALTLFYVGLWLMMVSFVLRIQYSFESQPYIAYSPLIIKILYFLLFLSLAMVIAMNMVSMIPQMGYYFMYFVYPLFAFQIMFSILLIVSLFSKIFNVMQQRLDSKLRAAAEPVSGGTKDDPKDPSLKQISLKSIHTVTRFALLMFAGIISTYISSALVIVDFELKLGASSHLFPVAQVCWALDLLINAVAVYLLFEHSTTLYHALCGRCHGICETLCVCMIYRRSKDSIGRVHHRNDFSDLILKDDLDNKAVPSDPTQQSQGTEAGGKVSSATDLAKSEKDVEMALADVVASE